jgi:hypothetical protein
MDWLEKLVDILMFIILALLVIILIWCIWGIINCGSSGSLSFVEMQCLKITTGLL